MKSRERILAKVRAGVAADVPAAGRPSEAERRAIVERRLADPPAHPVPARVAGKPASELPAILRHWIEAAGGEMLEAATPADLPSTIAGYLRRHNLPARVRMGADRRLAAVPWAREPNITVAHGRADAADAVGVTHALAAIAETGTLLVPSGADNPVTLSFLPETNIVVVSRSDIVGPLEEALRKTRAAGALPRTINLISGPSRSADIGGIPVLGAHGPRRLCLIVIG